jgi:hypothetical protein
VPAEIYSSKSESSLVFGTVIVDDLQEQSASVYGEQIRYGRQFALADPSRAAIAPSTGCNCQALISDELNQLQKAQADLVAARHRILFASHHEVEIQKGSFGAGARSILARYCHPRLLQFSCRPDGNVLQNRPANILNATINVHFE